MIDPYGLLFDICAQCHRTIDAGKDALTNQLTSDDDNDDSPEARHSLERAVRAAKELMGHLDSSYDWSGAGSAELKEGLCLE